jgi:hypothetical protein
MTGMDRKAALGQLGLRDGDHLTIDEIKEAYRLIVQRNHPDKFQSDEKQKKSAEEQMKLINEAWEVLKKEEEGQKSKGSSSGGGGGAEKKPPREKGAQGRTGGAARTQTEAPPSPESEQETDTGEQKQEKNERRRDAEDDKGQWAPPSPPPPPPRGAAVPPGKEGSVVYLDSMEDAEALKDVLKASGIEAGARLWESRPAILFWTADGDIALPIIGKMKGKMMEERRAEEERVRKSAQTLFHSLLTFCILTGFALLASIAAITVSVIYMPIESIGGWSGRDEAEKTLHIVASFCSIFTYMELAALTLWLVSRIRLVGWIIGVLVMTVPPSLYTAMVRVVGDKQQQAYVIVASSLVVAAAIVFILQRLIRKKKSLRTPAKKKGAGRAG